jgi:hypothetical protein
MGGTACTEPQCLHKGALYLYFYRPLLTPKRRGKSPFTLNKHIFYNYFVLLQNLYLIFSKYAPKSMTRPFLLPLNMLLQATFFLGVPSPLCV